MSDDDLQTWEFDVPGGPARCIVRTITVPILDAPEMYMAMFANHMEGKELCNA